MAEFFRDIQVGMDVGKMVELGKFDKEFTVYGCAYRQNGETYFPISEREETIYRLCERKQLEGIYPSKVMHYHIATSVPAGAIDDIWDDVKWKLGYQLMDIYSANYLDKLNELGNYESNNNMWPYLEEYMEQLEGIFSKELLELFDSISVDCFLRKQIDKDHYNTIKTWSNKIWQQMENDPEIKNIHSRSLNGCAYLDNDRIKYKVNAQYVHVYKSRQDLMCHGFIVTPIYSETCWYQTQTQFPSLRKKYENNLKNLMRPTIELMKIIYKQKPYQGKEDFLNYYNDVVKNASDVVKDTFTIYGYLWNCLQ